MVSGPMKIFYCGSAKHQTNQVTTHVPCSFSRFKAWNWLSKIDLTSCVILAAYRDALTAEKQPRCISIFTTIKANQGIRQTAGK